MSAARGGGPDAAAARVLNPGVGPREVFAWAMYDFANSGYTTVVLTAVFNAYFVGVVAQGAPWATLAWTSTLAASYAIVMVAMPALGAWADARAAKKRLLAIVTAGCVASTALLALAGRGDLALAVAAVILSNVCYSAGESLAAAFLPELARPRALGRVSGWGWSFGYLGGMLSLGVSLAYVLHAQAAGRSAEQFVPVTLLITAGVYGAASLVTFAWLRERATRTPEKGDGHDLPGRGTPFEGGESGDGHDFPARGPASEASSLATPARRARWRALVRGHRDFAWLLACGACYQAGIAVVVALAAVYAEQVMGFTQARTMALVFVVNIASAVGAFLFGHAQDRIGARAALAVTLAGWIVTTGVAAFSATAAQFWVAAALAGLCMGASQSCGRALAGLFAPARRSAEFYGFWTFATRVASIVGPVSYGLVTWVTAGDHRLAILSTGAFFVAGLALLAPIDIERGRRASLAADGDGQRATGTAHQASTGP